jgi:dihydropteroate synthase
MRRQLPVFGARPWVLGVLNVTPDSFSDGGLWNATDTAVAHARQLIADGADVIDIGGESTRPGAHRIDAETERRRVIPVITELAADGVLCSVDTTRAEVAEAAIAAGAAVVNDVSGGLADPAMASLVAETGVPWVLMHWRGESDVMHRLTNYDDVVRDVRGELLRQVEAALAAGVDERSLIVDPGLGFAKTPGHNWELLRRLDELVAIGLPVLVGASRKRFLGDLLVRDDDSPPRPPAGRDVATAAVSMVAAQHGVWGVRVHEPLSTLDAMRVAVAAAPIVQRRTDLAPAPLAVHTGSEFIDGAPLRSGHLEV